MSLHPLQLPTGQGHLKIKSVLAWQQFLAGQSPTYHEVVRWLSPSQGYPWVSEDHPVSVLRVEVALGQEKTMPSGGWRYCVAPPSVCMAFPWCQLVIRSGPGSFQELAVSQAGGHRKMADKACAPVFQDAPLLLPVLLEL